MPKKKYYTLLRPNIRKGRANLGGRYNVTRRLIAMGVPSKVAETAVNTVFRAWKQALIRHEDIETPFGTLKVCDTTLYRDIRKMPGQQHPKLIRFRRYKKVIRLAVNKDFNL